MLMEPEIEVLHLIAEFLDVIDHDQSIRSHLGNGEKKVVEIFALHRINIDEVKKSISKRWDDRFCISPESVNILYFAIPKVLDGFYMSIPCVFDSCNSLIESWNICIL